jgi:hypothetical protein
LLSSTNNSLPTSGEGITVITVARGDTSGNTAQRLGQLGSQAGTAGRMVGLDVSTSPTSTSNGGAGFRFNNGASLYDTPIVNAGFHIVTWRVDHGQSYADATLFVDGTQPANTFTGSTASGTTNFTGTDLELILGTGRAAGGALQGGDYYTGQLAELLVFNAQLSVGQINLVANYLSSEYGLPFAYETNLLFSQAALLGDHNHDGVVDGADYVLWRKTGIYGQQGYTDWRNNFGKTMGSGLSLPGSSLAPQLPEPSAWTIMAIGFVLASCRGRRGLRRHPID